MKRILVYTILMMGVCNTSAQKIHSLNELDDELTQNPKNILIKLSTNWCGICKIQDKKIRKNKELNEILTHRVYYFEFDAESKEVFQFQGIEFNPGKNKTHEFAEVLLQGNLTFPAWIIFNPNLEIIYQYNGLIDAEKLKHILLKLN